MSSPNKLKVLVSGSTGFIGSALVELLSSRGHEPVRLSRAARPPAGTIAWNPVTGETDLSAWEGMDAVVHLAGESIQGRWTQEKKRRIRESRVIGTRTLCANLEKLKNRPRVLICASASGFYGHRGNEPLTEQSAPGEGFLAEVCREWESESRRAVQWGIRVVSSRFGVVLDPEGGALAKMRLPFRLGVGGPIGDGTQYMPWVAREDAVNALVYAAETESLDGPMNVTAPEQVTNREFTKALSRALRRPAFFRLPAFAVKAVLGQMGEELLLSSARVEPKRLVAAGFAFRYPRLEPALRAFLRG